MVLSYFERGIFLMKKPIQVVSTPVKGTETEVLYWYWWVKPNVIDNTENDSLLFLIQKELLNELYGKIIQQCKRDQYKKNFHKIKKLKKFISMI